MPGFKKYSNDRNKKTRKSAPRQEYKKYRVRTAIKTFRDLEVYKQTTQLSSEIFQLEISAAEKNEAKLIDEAEILYNLSKNIPRLIAESYGDKFSEFDKAMKKLEKTAQLISTVISKIDFLTAAVETQKTKEVLNKFLKKYQIQRVKILNLKKAWIRVFGGDSRLRGNDKGGGGE